MKHSIDAGLADYGVSRETLQPFVDLLQRWNTRINLVADAGDDLWHRHILDSLQLVPLVAHGSGPLVDLGSGAGFPGLLLALTTGRPTHLVESDKRKSAFLLEAARSLGLANVSVHAKRIEAAALPPAEVLTARALAPLPALLGYASRLLAPGGVAIFPKGRTAAQELMTAAQDWTMHVEKFPSRTDPGATILRLSEIRFVGAQPQ